jgi:preprotein translocase subunit SecA
MTTLGVPDDMPIENRLISKSIESAQKKVEGHNFDIRKHLVEYDDVLNKQREVIYKRRRQVIRLSENKDVLPDDEFQNTKDLVFDMLKKEIEKIVTFHYQTEDQKEIYESLNTIFPLAQAEAEKLKEELSHSADQGIKYAQNLALEKYNSMEQTLNAKLVDGATNPLRELEKILLIRTIDELWIEHLEALEHLRTGIGLRGYGQRDPLVEYKHDSFNLFQQLLDLIQDQVTHTIFKMAMASDIAFNQNQAPKKAVEVKQNINQFAELKGDKTEKSSPIVSKATDSEGHKIGRNDPCPCGSGLKYKKCHGK